MGLLSTFDKEKIKRALPKASNKIIDVTVARLYIAYPHVQEWQYTGLSGAIVLVDDIVGHTFFIKLVDIEGHRGVLWDQELYVDFEYNQDRTFFHTFEIEQCYAGLLFEDLSEAGHFLKRVCKREKYASKKTLSNKNAVLLSKKLNYEKDENIVHGPRGEPLINDQRQRYSYDNSDILPIIKKKAPPPPPPLNTDKQHVLPPAMSYDHETRRDENETDCVTTNSDDTSGISSCSTPAPINPELQAKHRLPPPPAQFVSLIQEPEGPSHSLNQRPKLPIPQPLHSNAQPVVKSSLPGLPHGRTHETNLLGENVLKTTFNAPLSSSGRGPAPPPPPRRTISSSVHKYVPGNPTQPSSNRPVPPPPPRRSAVPPLPSRNIQSNREISSLPAQRQQLSTQVPPPVVTQHNAHVSAPQQNIHVPSLSQHSSHAPPPPPLLQEQVIPASQTLSDIPPPPPIPSITSKQNINEDLNSKNINTPPMDALLASIRNTSIKSLRSVDKSQLEKPSVLLREARGETITATSTGNKSVSPNGAPASLADALAIALTQRNKKAGNAEDDYDAGDDW